MTTKTKKGDFIAIGFIQALVYQPAPHLPKFILTFEGDSIMATHCQSGETIEFNAHAPAWVIKARLDEEILDIMLDEEILDIMRDDEALYDEPIVWIDIDDFMAVA